MKFIDKLRISRKMNKLTEDNATTQVKAIERFNKAIIKMCNLMERGHDLSGGLYIEENVLQIIITNLVKQKDWRNLKVPRLRQTFQQHFTQAQSIKLARLIILELDLLKRRNH